MPNKAGLYIGLMSGTSLDGIDAVLVDFGGALPDSTTVRVISHVSAPLQPVLRDELLALNAPGLNELQRSALAANALAQAYAALVRQLLRQADISAHDVSAIGAHGQTLRHRPGEFDGIGFTIQLNNPALLAELSGIDVIADFRSRDVVAGGQGAPLVSAFHRAVFGRPGQSIAVLNLGGIANLTLLRADGSTAGFDCGPANALMDHWTQRHLGTPFDTDGAWAATGRPNPALLHAFLADPFLALPPPKSTGRDLFNVDWLENRLRSVAGASTALPEDVQATLAEFTVLAAAEALHREFPDVAELLVCGGGAFNGHLMRRLGVALPSMKVRRTDSSGLPAIEVEAAAFAWLAMAFVERQPGNIPEVTGARGPRILGALYPK